MKKNVKKLTLSKVTLADLSREDQNQAKGGTADTNAPRCTLGRVCGFSKWDCDTLTFDPVVCM